MYFCKYMSAEEDIKKDLYYMQFALEEAKQAYKEKEIPIGAIIVCKDRIIARAHNLTERLHDVTAHAEMQAITIAANELGGKYLEGCTLYVTVEPCIMCAGALGWSQMKRIVFGCIDDKRGYHTYAPKALHPKANIIGGIMENECKELMLRFFKERR
ncbi:cytidine and deoxycytidylate deaminase zinc-binding region [Prevotella amnii CRIS 21A-A]|uniref:tRNA-specific adenosine deaminase n=2 Tax=Prevotella amnii TaxID=419005 RepID=E1GXA4_9BACT|nr:cytidine and deoxycytidylate deaminase zinc-binding region [Prevotella amnii CRIS 21A-A]